MTYAATMRKLEASKRREERDAKKRQRDLERRMKERQKLSELESAKLEVETYANAIEVLLSVHKESAPVFDWTACAFALPSPPPVPSRKWQVLYELRAALDPLSLPVSSWLPASGEEAIQRDAAEDSRQLAMYQLEYADWQEMRDLGRRVLAGESAAYIEAISKYSNLAELSTVGSELHFTVHGPKALEFRITVNGRNSIPQEVKSLTASGKLSSKPMPKGKFNELYQDYVCGCLLRVAREVFALLPVETVLAHARVPVADRATGLDREINVASVVFPRERLQALDFSRLDPSDTIESFPHSGSVKASRSTGEFQEALPLSLAAPPSGSSESENFADLMARLRSAREVLARFTRERLRQRTVSSAPTV